MREPGDAEGAAHVTDPRKALAERLAQLRTAWLGRLGCDVERMKVLLRGLELRLDEAELEEMVRLAHNIAGSGTTFGFPAASGAARELEQTLDTLCRERRPPSGDERTQIDRLLHALSETGRTS